MSLNLTARIGLLLTVLIVLTALASLVDLTTLVGPVDFLSLYSILS
jgi:hypothetical protein